MNFPKIPQPLKAPPSNPKPIALVQREEIEPKILEAIEIGRDLIRDPGPTNDKVLDARAHMRKVHGDLKELRKNPPEDVKGAMWFLSLAKVLDETLDEYFKKVGP